MLKIKMFLEEYYKICEHKSQQEMKPKMIRVCCS